MFCTYLSHEYDVPIIVTQKRTFCKHSVTFVSNFRYVVPTLEGAR